MRQLNYSHLHYFYVIAREGSISRAAEVLHITPQTISNQLAIVEDRLEVQLFERRGKRLVITQAGEIAYSFCKDIFGLCDEMLDALKAQKLGQQTTFKVGVVDVVPKVLAFDLLKQPFADTGSIRVVSKQGDLESLSSDLALNRLDIIISDRPMPKDTNVNAYSHYLGESGFTFYAAANKATEIANGFPESLDGTDFLMPGENSTQRSNLLSWFDRINVNPKIVGEYDDSALMKFFGQAGYGVFCSPASIESFVLQEFDVRAVGKTDEIREHFYAISPERKIKHPAVEKIVAEAKRVFNA